MMIFGICLVISVIIFMLGMYRYKNSDYLMGFLIGALVMFLLSMGASSINW